MQHRCMMLAVEKSTSQLLYRSQTSCPNIQLPKIASDALNVIAKRATRMSAQAKLTY